MHPFPTLALERAYHHATTFLSELDSRPINATRSVGELQDALHHSLPRQGLSADEDDVQRTAQAIAKVLHLESLAWSSPAS